jgi:hypothetical protein
MQLHFARASVPNEKPRRILLGFLFQDWEYLCVKRMPGVCGPDGDDADGDQGGEHSKDANIGLNLVDAFDDFYVLALASGVDVGEKEPFLLVAGKLSAIRKKGDKAGCDRGPDNEHGGYGLHGRCEAHCVRLLPWGNAGLRYRTVLQKLFLCGCFAPVSMQPSQCLDSLHANNTLSGGEWAEI